MNTYFKTACNNVIPSTDKKNYLLKEGLALQNVANVSINPFLFCKEINFKLN